MDMKGRARGFAQDWIWRLSATATWLWIIGHFTKSDTVLHPIRGLPFLHLVAGIILSLAAYLLIKEKKSEGWAAVFLGYPFYTLFFPLLIAAYAFAWASTVAYHGAKVSQGFLASIAPYLVTITIYLALTYEPPTVAVWFVFLVAVVNLFFVYISLGSWIFYPLAWASGAVGWWIGFVEKHWACKSMPTEEDLRTGLPEHRIALAKAVEGLQEAHGYLAKVPLITIGKLEPKHQDLLLTLAFCRKFVFAVLHASVIFGFLHYLLNGRIGVGPPVYSGLPQSNLADCWFQYVYFGAMTLISGNSGSLALSNSARSLVLLNALGGAVFLVLLVNAFSLLTRERAREGIDALDGRAGLCIQRIERSLAEAACIAARTANFTPELHEKLNKLTSLSRLTQEEQRGFAGVLYVQSVIARLNSIQEFEKAAAVQKNSANLDLAGYARVLAAGNSVTNAPFAVVQEMIAEALKVPQQELFGGVG